MKPKTHPLLSLMLLIVATWRMSHMLIYENGPSEVFETVRFYMSQSVLRGLETCIYCMSIWVGAVLLLLSPFRLGQFIIRVLVLSAGAVFIHEANEARKVVD